MTPSVVGDAPVAGAPAADAPTADFLAVLAAAVGDAAPAVGVSTDGATIASTGDASPAVGTPVAFGADLASATAPEARPAIATAPALPNPVAPATSPVAAPGSEAGLPLPTGCSCCAAPSASPSPPAGPGRVAASAASLGRVGAVSAPLAPRVAVDRYAADVVGSVAPATIEAAPAPSPAAETAAPPSSSLQAAASVAAPAAADRPGATSEPVRTDVALAAALPPSFDRPPLPDGSAHLAGGRGPSRSVARPVSHSIVRPQVATGDAPVPPAMAQAAAVVSAPVAPRTAEHTVVAATSPTASPSAVAPSVGRQMAAVTDRAAAQATPLAARADEELAPVRITGTDRGAPGDDGDAADGTGDVVTDLATSPSPLPTGASPVRAGVTAAGSHAAMPSSLGMVGTERVETVRRLQGTQPLQRLSVDLDDTKVAVRVRGGRLSVDVVSDPQGVLGEGWARQVERTLDQAVRLQEVAPRHEAPRAAAAEHGSPSGANQSDRHQPTPDDDERRQRRQFVWDMEEER